MSIKITAKGDRLFKEMKAGHEIEIFGEEKAFYLMELGRIDQGEKVGQKVTNAHRVNCKCHECLSPEDIANIRAEEEAVNRGY